MKFCKKIKIDGWIKRFPHFLWFISTAILTTSTFFVEVYANQILAPSLQVVSVNSRALVYECSEEVVIAPFFKLLIPTEPAFDYQTDQVLFHGTMFCYDSLLVNGVIKHFEIQDKKDINIQNWIPAAVSFEIKNLPEVRVLLKSDVLLEEENPVDIVIPRSCLSEFRKLLLMEELQIEVSVVGKIQNEDIHFQTQMVYERDPGLPTSLETVYVSENDIANRLQKRVLTPRKNLKGGAFRFDMMPTAGYRILPETIVSVFHLRGEECKAENYGVSFEYPANFSECFSFNIWFSEACKKGMEAEFFYEEIKKNTDANRQKIIPVKGDEPAFLSFSFSQRFSAEKQCLGLEAEYSNGEKKLWKAPGHYPYLDLTLSSGNVNGKLLNNLYGEASRKFVSNQSDGIIIYAHGKEKTYIQKKINAIQQRKMENAEWIYKSWPFFKVLLPENVADVETRGKVRNVFLLQNSLLYYGALDTNIFMKTYGIGSFENIGEGDLNFLVADVVDVQCMTSVHFTNTTGNVNAKHIFDKTAKEDIRFLVPNNLRRKFMPHFEEGELNVYANLVWGTNQLSQKVIFDEVPGNLDGAEVVYVRKNIMKERHQTFTLHSPSVGADITETFQIIATPGYEIDPETVTLLYAGKNIPVTRYGFNDPVYDGGKSFSVTAWITGSDEDNEEAELEINVFYREYDIVNREKEENKKSFSKAYLNRKVEIIPDASFDKENFYWDRCILRYNDQYRVMTIPGVLNNCIVDYDQENLKTEIHLF